MVKLPKHAVEWVHAFLQLSWFDASRDKKPIMAKIVLINPRFEASYWGLEHALPLLGKRANVPPACLPLLAALTPDEHQVTLLDENVQPIDYDRVAQADIVGLTGMNIQRARAREILTELKQRGAFTVVGGPWASVCENYFGDLVDVVFVGEAEETWPLFLVGWREGHYEQRYEQPERTDMTRVPVPRACSSSEARAAPVPASEASR